MLDASNYWSQPPEIQDVLKTVIDAVATMKEQMDVFMMTHAYDECVRMFEQVNQEIRKSGKKLYEMTSDNLIQEQKALCLRKLQLCQAQNDPDAEWWESELGIIAFELLRRQKLS